MHTEAEGNAVRFTERELPKDVATGTPRLKPRSFIVTWAPSGRDMLHQLCAAHNRNLLPHRRWHVQDQTLESGDPVVVLRLNKSNKGHLAFDESCERLLGPTQSRLFRPGWILSDDAKAAFSAAIKRNARPPADADKKTAKRVERRREAARAGAR
jgi:hypothetical protein